MLRDKKVVRALGVLCLLLAWWAFRHRPATGPAHDAKAGVQAALFTGMEPKRKVTLALISKPKGSVEMVEAEIYRTASAVNQAKQVVLALMDGDGKTYP